jgi:glycosyltransferase involved in cell wall biosynthesis
MNVSIICACKNREESLRISLQSWLCFDQIKEIIIVDWSSDKSLNYLTLIDSKIKIITVKNENHFNLSQPLNLAAKIATGDAILKLDCDYILNPYHSFFKNYKLEEGTFISGNHNVKHYETWNGNGYGIDLQNMHIVDIYDYVVTYTHYFKYLKGMLFVHRNIFEQIGGFNEGIDSYGWEDSDIIHRLELLGLEHKKINYDHSLIHIPHPDRKRFEHCKSYKEEDEEEFKQCVPAEFDDDRKMWEVEYLLSHKYIGENKDKFVQLDTPYCEPKMNWNIKQIDNQTFTAEKENKLSNFPSSYYLSFIIFLQLQLSQNDLLNVITKLLVLP